MPCKNDCFWYKKMELYKGKTLGKLEMSHLTYFKGQTEQLQKSLLFFFFLFFSFFNFLKNFILFLNFTILYWFCQISKWICHRLIAEKKKKKQNLTELCICLLRMVSHFSALNISFSFLPPSFHPFLFSQSRFSQCKSPSLKGCDSSSEFTVFFRHEFSPWVGKIPLGWEESPGEGNE